MGGALVDGVIEGVLAGKANERGGSVNSERSQPGQNWNFDELFLAHYGRIVSILRRLIREQGQAEDVANEVFLRLYRRGATVNALGNIPGWLYRCAVNLGIDHVRARNRRDRYEQEAARAETRAQHPEDGFEQMRRVQRQERVRLVLAELKPEQAELLLSRAAGHSYRELAERLDIGINSVGNLLIRAEAAFEKQYHEKFGKEEDV